MKIAIIVPYFGKMPNYFQLFLNSCASNKKFDWMIFSDDKTKYYYPENVHFIKMTFQECQNLVQSKFDFQIELSRPQKLCDYKCAYGLVFKQFLQDYDWWGHCDLDQIFGDLEAFITDDMLRHYDKIGSLGHLTLYRNTLDNCKVFMSPLNGRTRYREVFGLQKGCAFDEWLPDNINEIYINSGRPIMLENMGADVNSYYTQFSLTTFDLKKRQYIKSDIKNSIFMLEKGKLFQMYIGKTGLEKMEYPYVHLQKRRMKDIRSEFNAKDYYIMPNRFVDKTNDPMKLLLKSKKWKVLNYQYFKVKAQSLRYRIKSGDWTFSSVFKM